ncbi:MAG: hypothetical protein PHY16_17275 [Methylobacter sp.]|nr:hypothetical protein [Methylobacter sp.]
MKSVLKPLAVILTVTGIYFWGSQGENTTINGKVFNTKGKDSEVARALSPQRQQVQGEGKNMALSSAPETEVDDPEAITRLASLEPILVELTPAEPEPETEVDDPQEITGMTGLEPILDELAPAEPEPETEVDDPEAMTDMTSLDPILDELAPAEPEPETEVDDPQEITHTAGVVE